MLRKHEGVRFSGEVIQTAGQAFIDCRFERATLVVQDPATTVFDGCRFDDCAWHLNVSLEDAAGCLALLTLLRTVQETLPRTARRMRIGQSPQYALCA